jgi:DNA-binding SARP family transcriptional activator
MQPHSDIRIRLLGDLEVRRVDGTFVGHDEWRTGKSMDLLRILALSNQRPAQVTSVVHKLWPGVSMDRARASVRTAASHIRRAVGSNCVVRQNGSLVLSGARVDAIEFLEGARDAERTARAGDHRRTLEIAELTDRLYVGDFHAHNDDSAWAVAERNHLRQARLQLLCRAAEAALAVGDYAAALDFAEKAVEIERTSESAHRAMMRAYAGLGETASALRAFEACRSHLAEELGADPSVQTQSLHLRLLRGELSGRE